MDSLSIILATILIVAFLGIVYETGKTAGKTEGIKKGREDGIRDLLRQQLKRFGDKIINEDYEKSVKGYKEACEKIFGKR